ncbi:MAG: TonB-dependent receptor [Tannerella sp.]|jgi:outer membrane cobalamin receptor|nr:TonB-dependent receptor [Tannerella sp.]
MQKKLFAKMKVCLAGACFACFTVAKAQQPEERADTVKSRQLPDVEVVAAQRASATKQGSPLQIIDNKNIKRLGISELHEAVRRFSGVTIKDYGGIGGLKTVSIRSLGAQHTAVGYDGVPISDAQSGQIDISRFTLDNVDMISLSMGQTDDIFLTARIYSSAGALNIKTLKPVFSDAKKYNLTAKFKSGSFGMYNPVLSLSRKLGDRSSAVVHADYMGASGEYPYTLSNGSVKTSEKRLNSDIRTFRIEADVYAGFSRWGSLDTKLYLFDSERGLPGSVNFYNKTATERLWNDNSFIQTQYNNELSDRFKVRAIAKYTYSYSKYRDVDDKYAAGFQEDRNTQTEYYGSIGVLYTPLTHLSASFTTDFSHSALSNNFNNSPLPRRNNLLSVLSAQYSASALTVTGSLLGTYISDEVENGERPKDRRRLSPAASLSWRPFANNALRLRVSYKDVFRVPTFTDLYYLRIGNTNLKPEKAKQYNAGITWSGSAGRKVNYVSVSLDCYYNTVEDKIVALPTLYIWRMMNLGEVRIKGADVNVAAEAALSEKTNMIISGNYTCQKAIDVTNPEAKNYKDQIPYTPRHSGNCSVAFETPWLNFSYLLTAVGERYAMPQNIKSNRIEAYTEQNVSLNRTFNLGKLSLRLQGEILNIADTQYDVIQYYPMPGRSWRLSVALNL